MISDAPRARRRRQHVWPNIERAEVRTKVWLELDGRFVAGEGGLALLAGIAAHRSLARAAREVGWSYRHAWGYLRHAERLLGVALTRPIAGRGTARGMTLTAAGEQLRRRLDRLRRAVHLRAAQTRARVRSA